MKKDFIIFENQKEAVKIRIDDILAVTCEGYCSTIHYGKELKKFTFCKSLVKIEKELSQNDTWLYANRNTIVPLEKIELLDKQNKKIFLQGKLEFPVSVRNISTIYNRIIEYSTLN